MAEAHPSKMYSVLVSNYFCKSALANQCNNPNETLLYARKNLSLREEKGVVDEGLAIAYNEVAVGLMLKHCYEDAVDFANKSIEAFKILPTYGDTSYPNFAWLVIGFSWWLRNNFNKSAEVFEEYAKWRTQRWGPNDTESLK
jgi:hypothetical protein